MTYETYIEINIPTFFKGKNRIHSKTLLHDRKISEQASPRQTGNWPMHYVEQ